MKQIKNTKLKIGSNILGDILIASKENEFNSAAQRFAHKPLYVDRAELKPLIKALKKKLKEK